MTVTPIGRDAVPVTDEPPKGERGVSYDQDLVFSTFDNGAVFDYDQQTVKDLQEMLDRDGKARGLESILTLPLRSAKFSIKAAKGDKGEAEAVTEALTVPPYGGGMSTPMQLVVAQATAALVFRRTYHEKVFTTRDGMVVYDKIAWRPPATCRVKINPATGGFRGFEQDPIRPDDPRAEPIQIDAPRALVHVNGRHRDPILGHSDLSVAYWAYQTKARIRWLWYRFLQQQSLPNLHVKAPSGPEADEAARKVAEIKSGGIVGTAKTVEIDVLQWSGNGSGQFADAMRWLDGEASMSVLAGFMDLTGAAASGTGSYALSKDQSDFFLQSREASATEIAATFSNYLIPDLVRYKFGPRAAFPCFEFGPLAEFNIDQIINLLGTLTVSPSLRMVPDEFLAELVTRTAGFLELDPDKVRKGLEVAAKRAEDQAAVDAQQKKLGLDQAKANIAVAKVAGPVAMAQRAVAAGPKAQAANRPRSRSQTALSASGRRNLDLAAGRHVAGKPYRYRHGWIPINPTEAAGLSAPTPGHCEHCGKPTRGGSFLPGHDAAYVSDLRKKVLAGELTKDQARAKLAQFPKLTEKLNRHFEGTAGTTPKPKPKAAPARTPELPVDDLKARIATIRGRYSDRQTLGRRFETDEMQITALNVKIAEKSLQSHDLEAKAARQRNAKLAYSHIAKGYVDEEQHRADRTQLKAELDQARRELKRAERERTGKEGEYRPDPEADGGPKQDLLDRVDEVKETGRLLEQRAKKQAAESTGWDRAEYDSVLERSRQVAADEMDLKVEYARRAGFDNPTAWIHYADQQDWTSQQRREEHFKVFGGLSTDPAMNKIVRRRQAMYRERQMWDQKWARYREALARARLDTLSQIRGMGRDEDHWLTVNGPDESVQRVAQASSYYPTDWIAAAKTKRIVAKDVARGYYLDSGGGQVDQPGELALSNNPKARGDSVAIHELGHYFEAQYAGVKALQWAYFWSRTSDGPVGSRTQQAKQNLAKLKPGHSYRPDERAIPDAFADPYAGKVYGGDANSPWEIFTLGMEGLFAGTDYADADQRNFVLGILAVL